MIRRLTDRTLFFKWLTAEGVSPYQRSLWAPAALDRLLLAAGTTQERPAQRSPPARELRLGPASRRGLEGADYWHTRNTHLLFVAQWRGAIAPFYPIRGKVVVQTARLLYPVYVSTGCVRVDFQEIRARAAHIGQGWSTSRRRRSGSPGRIGCSPTSPTICRGPAHDLPHHPRPGRPHHARGGGGRERRERGPPAGGAAVCDAIYRGAGPQLMRHTEALVWCPTGSAVLTPGFELRARTIIHAVAPRWHPGPVHEQDLLEALLIAAYHTTYQLAHAHQVRSIAVPALGCGFFHWAPYRAATIAVAAARWAVERDPTLAVTALLSRSRGACGVRARPHAGLGPHTS
jgi:O-acetyl-ADP-ribose deacetylase (regulator of RNase III)